MQVLGAVDETDFAYFANNPRSVMKGHNTETFRRDACQPHKYCFISIAQFSLCDSFVLKVSCQLIFRERGRFTRSPFIQMILLSRRFRRKMVESMAAIIFAVNAVALFDSSFGIVISRVHFDIRSSGNILL